MTRSGTGGGAGGAKTSRRKKIDRKDTKTVKNVVDLVFVIESMFERRKLNNAINGSRCCTSARIAKRMSGDLD